MNVRPAIVEKDFRVCWTLKRAFSLREDIPGLIFKGDTSLSKAYGIIRRFSEDIDLSLDRKDLGFAEDRDPASAPGNKVRKTLLDELRKEAENIVSGRLKEAFANAMSEALGTEVRLEIANDDPQTLIFTYPDCLPASAGLAYIRPSVRLE